MRLCLFFTVVFLLAAGCPQMKSPASGVELSLQVFDEARGTKGIVQEDANVFSVDSAALPREVLEFSIVNHGPEEIAVRETRFACGGRNLQEVEGENKMTADLGKAFFACWECPGDPACQLKDARERMEEGCMLKESESLIALPVGGKAFFVAVLENVPGANADVDCLFELAHGADLAGEDVTGTERFEARIKLRAGE